MRQTFANLPERIETSIENILAKQEDGTWVMRAAELHERYTTRNKEDSYIRDMTDAMAYLAMRVPATYAQLFGAFSFLQEVIPSWEPESVLDIGSGPGTGVWAAKTVWPSLVHAVCVDNNNDLLQLGKQIASDANFSVRVDWKQQQLKRGLEQSEQYDLVIIGNVLNELSVSEGEKLIGQAFNLTRGLVLVVESGTPYGYGIVQSVAKKLSKAGKLITPYINNSFVAAKDFWLHFPQRFIRPEFSRRIRQHMRENSRMASDWEEAKYSYVAIGKFGPEISAWARVAGPVKVQKGYLEVPILTAEKIETVKIMKRDKEKFMYARKLNWGDLITEPIMNVPGFEPV